MAVTRRSDGKILYANQNTTSILGLSPQQLIGRKTSDFYDDPAERVKILEMIKQNGRIHNYEQKIKRADGTISWRLVSCEPLLFHGEPALLIGYLDITARKQAETTIRESQNRYQVLFDEAPTPLWEIDMSAVKSLLEQWQKRGVDNLRVFLAEHPEAVEQCLSLIKTLDVNQVAWRLYQADSKEQLIANARQIWNAESMSAFKEQLLVIAAGKTDNEFETSQQTLRGKKLNIWVHWHVVPGCEQSLAKIFIATIDVTERVKTLDELQASRARLRALSAHLQSSREQERLAIARDLHDELGQALTSLKMDMSMLERKAQSANGQFDCAAVLGDIAIMQERIAETIKHVRGLITELRPEVLDTLGLLPALEWQLEEFYKRTGMPFDFDSTVADLNVPSAHAVAVFRIFQESLTNIARHANAGRVSAKIEKRDAALWVEISDDGRGISPEEFNAPGKFGLLGMRERALVFGGEVEITGAPGRGTTVKIKVPLSEEERVGES
jgi:PAS domain S-box-containing protein